MYHLNILLAAMAQEQKTRKALLT